MHAARSLSVLVLVAALVALGGAARPAYAQQTDWSQSRDPFVGALGLAGGLTSGTGLAVRWPALPQTMMGLAGGAWGKSSDLAWNLGVELHYVLRQVGRTRLFFGPAAGFYSDDEDDRTDVNLSLNIGIERLLRTRTALKLDIGFTRLGEEKAVYPLPQIGLYYYF